MSRRELSDSTLDALAAVRCPRCRMRMLPEHPHNHETPPSQDYDPMPVKPPTLDARLALIVRDYGAELPVRLHTRQVPSRAEPIGVSQYSAEAAGYVPGEMEADVLDSGELGSPPWSPAFHRYIGAARFWEGEMVMADGDLRPYPWKRNLEGVRRWCAGKHRTWYEHRGLPLCWTLIGLVLPSPLGEGYSLGRAAKHEGISPEKADALLTMAIDKWWAWTSNDLNRIEMRPRRPAA